VFSLNEAQEGSVLLPQGSSPFFLQAEREQGV